MKILAVSDVNAAAYYDYYTPGKLDGVDLILACGDLHREYLEFLVTMSHCPLVYVHGNHDDGLDERPPEGCVCADDKLVVVNGLRILGLGGSYRYKDGEHMFTEKQMRRRIRALRFQIFKRRGFDILLTHAPARHINDFDSLSHRGFECFLALLDRYRPRYFIHGHIHMNYGVHIPQKTVRGETTIINAYEYCLFDWEDASPDAKGKAL